jgi:hypothetical protein
MSSPGNELSNGIHPMRLPNLEFLYRLECTMSSERHPVGGAKGTQVSRMILPIVGGTVRGPRLSGIIQENSGADWAEMVGEKGVG